MKINIRQVIFTILILSIFYLSYLSQKSIIVNRIKDLERINFIILGTDFVDNAVHSDTILLISYSTKHKIFDIISIPRDSYIDFADTRFKKLTEVYAYLYKHNRKDKHLASKKFVELIEQKIFVSEGLNFSIPYYIVINYEGFKKLIDTIGKIKIYVTEPMHYDDNAGNLHIHFDVGEYLMDGESALKFVRYRDSRGDIGRIARQQQFFNSVMRKLMSPKVVIRIPSILLNVRESIYTNITFWEMINLLIEFRNIKTTGFRFSYVHGKPKGRYWEIDKSYINNLVQYLNSDDKQIKNINKRIKIFNASNVPKLATRVTKYLRSIGYDVLDWGNWTTILPQSKIIDYSGDENLVSTISNLLNIDDVTTYYKSNDYLAEAEDLIIILGNDFDNKTIAGPMSEF
ncbi:MAG: LCP family protein [Endomicrobiia bacterium]